MIEVTFTELALLVWALLATAYALRYRHERTMLGRILQQITEDPTLYAQVRDGWESVRKQFVKN